jgi:hypothetical protein
LKGGDFSPPFFSYTWKANPLHEDTMNMLTSSTAHDTTLSAQVRADASDRRSQLFEAYPELELALLHIATALHLGVGSTLDWIVAFAALADDSVVEFFGAEVQARFRQDGYAANEALPLGAMLARKERLRTDRNEYGHYVIGLFMEDLSQGRELVRDFTSARDHYDLMP